MASIGMFLNVVICKSYAQTGLVSPEIGHSCVSKLAVVRMPPKRVHGEMECQVKDKKKTNKNLNLFVGILVLQFKIAFKIQKSFTRQSLKDLYLTWSTILNAFSSNTCLAQNNFDRVISSRLCNP